jgi:hypothetical protein
MYPLAAKIVNTAGCSASALLRGLRHRRGQLELDAVWILKREHIDTE